MALLEVKVPQLSESVAEATLLTWKKKVGDAVAVDEILIEVETDKVVLEVPAPAAGVITALVKGDGATVVAEEVIATIDTEARAGAAAVAAPAAAAAPVAAAAPAAVSKAEVAMPSAAKLMADNHLAAGSVAGSGKDGRITKGDVLGALEAKLAVVAAPAAPVAAAKPALPQVKAPIDVSALANRPEQRVPMSRLRARIAERLVQSQSTAAILTTFNEVNMAPVMELRAKYKDKFEKEHGVKLGFMSFFVKAAVAALKKYPVVNASVDGNDIVYHG
ncbi:MAG: 2-oxo acid dehydrogenase subunit E2, partial [Burkholderiaceae bacterium]